MKSIEMSRFNRPLSLWGKLAAAGLLTAALVGCGGGSDGAAGATGATGPAGPAGSAGTAGTPGKDATAKVDANLMMAADWAAAKFKGEVTGVTSLSPLTVNFKLSDSATGYPVVGLSKNTSKNATALKAGYVNLAFSVAKLVPATADTPSSWVNYIVTTMPTTTAAAVPTRPSTDNTGTMTEDGAGGYTYTFYRDVTTIKAAVAAMTVTAPNDKAALGDLTWDPKLPHRLVVQLGGAARGTGSNTDNGATVTPGVNAANPVNLVYDFVPDTKAAIPAANLMREVVAIESCNTCHEKLAFHGGGSRVEAKFCVVCHNDQRKYGFANVASVNGAFPALTETKTVNPVTGITSFGYSPDTRLADGEVAGNFTTMIHKIHNGKELVKENYAYAGVAFNNKGFSMLGGGQKMCSVCHDSAKAVNAANWATKPSRVACGSCHDGINFATGGGSTLADKAAATAVGSVVGLSGHSQARLAQSNDALCATCHKEADIKAYHYTENVTKHNPVIEAGLKTFTYEIKSATVSATNDVTIEFGIKADGQPVTFVAPAASVANPLTGFTGGPGFLLAYAMPQDGISMPADYNNAGRKLAQPISVSIGSLLSTSSTAAANGSVKPSATAGYYTATILGSGANKFPVGATMRAVALQGYFTQTVEKAGFPTRAVARHAISVVKNVTGDAVRRTVVDKAKCSNCHEWFEGHGGNRVYDTQVCVTCHVPGLTTSGRGISNAALAAYPFTKADVKVMAEWKFDKTLPEAALQLPVVTNNFKDMIHGIHAGRDRVTPFMDARDRTPSAIVLLDFKRMDFPGKLNNCQTCHVSTTTANNSYNFVPANTLPSTYEYINAAYAATPTAANAKASLDTASMTDKVVTPFTAACVSCHDRADAKAHMTLNGGLINAARANAVGVVESCATCHGPGKTYDTSVAHQ